jgi:STE24 endopeptidase
VLALRLAPAAVARLGGAAPLSRAPLARRLEDLAARAGVPVAAILVAPAGRESAATALVGGLGRVRRVFLSSTLAHDWHDDEIAVVVAHELGHCAHQDAWRTVLLDAVLVCVALAAAEAALAVAAPAWGLPPAGAPAALPFLALIAGLVWLAATPLRHAQSRRHERRADAFALALTGSADAFDAAIRRLGAAHLAEERPGALTRWLFFRHPSVGERLEYAREYRDVTRVGGAGAS